MAPLRGAGQPGMRVAVTLGTYIEYFMKDYLKKAELQVIAPPATREAELVANRTDVIMRDYPTAVKVTTEFDWAETVDGLHIPWALGPSSLALQ